MSPVLGGATHAGVNVVAICAPLYVDAAQADERIKGPGWLERLFALEGPAAAAMCAWMCGHRTMAAWPMVALEPRWPVTIAHYGVRHTWPAYLRAMNDVIYNGGWEPALDQLEDRRIPVVLAEGAHDPCRSPDAQPPSRPSTATCGFPSTRALITNCRSPTPVGAWRWCGGIDAMPSPGKRGTRPAWV